MESGTSTFEDWLQSLSRTTAGEDLLARLEVLASRAGERCGARFWFARVLGRRWSYIAGHRSERPGDAVTVRFSLGSGIGLVVESWGGLPPAERDRLKFFLESMVAADTSLQEWR